MPNTSDAQRDRARKYWGTVCVIDGCAALIVRSRLCAEHLSCSIDACTAESVTSERLCKNHYMRKRRGAPIDGARKNARKACSVDDCDLKAISGGLCGKHLARVRRYGSTDLPRKPNPTRIGCQVCGVALPRHRSKYCSDSCSEHAMFYVRQAGHRTLYCRRHGITEQRYDEMLQEQGGGCAICGSTDPKGRAGSPYFQIDHDHSCCPGPYSCGKCVRGLLCAPHNSGLGAFHDDLKELQAGIEYLERYGA